MAYNRAGSTPAYGAQAQNPAFIQQQQQYQQQQAQQAQPYSPSNSVPQPLLSTGTPPPVVPTPTAYVYFERSPGGFRKDTLEKAQAAKLKLEHFYQKAVQDAIERNGRSVFPFVSSTFEQNVFAW